ncbi:MAG: hypothetical protein AB7U85_11060 [Alphaproteobacteria bacterium]
MEVFKTTFYAILNFIKTLTLKDFLTPSLLFPLTLPFAALLMLSAYASYNAFGVLLLASVVAVAGFPIKKILEPKTSLAYQFIKNVLFSLWVTALFTVAYVAMVSVVSVLIG